MHATVHRLEREKIALEQQIRSLRHLEQDKAILEERLKTLESMSLIIIYFLSILARICFGFHPTNVFLISFKKAMMSLNVFLMRFNKTETSC